MKDAHPILLLVAVAVGSGAVICTLLIHALPLIATVRFVCRERKLGHLGVHLRSDMTVVVRTMPSPHT